MKRPVLIAVVAIAVIAAIGLAIVLLPRLRAGPSPLDGAPVTIIHETVVIDGQRHDVRLFSYDPPVPATGPRYRSLATSRFDTPEAAHFSQLSAHDAEWFLATFTEDSRPALRALDASSDGRLFAAIVSGEDGWPPETPALFVARAEMTLDGRKVAFLRTRVQGGADSNAVFLYVEESGRWLRSWDGGPPAFAEWLVSQDVPGR